MNQKQQEQVANRLGWLRSCEDVLVNRCSGVASLLTMAREQGSWCNVGRLELALEVLRLELAAARAKTVLFEWVMRKLIPRKG